MLSIKIGVVEDELIIARTITNTLAELGYKHCGPAISYTEAMEMIEDEKPDFLLIDINLSGSKDGIDLAKRVNELYKIPFIFLTANTDRVTIERAKTANPNAYLVKPFKKDELFAAIEIAFSNFTSRAQISTDSANELHRNKEILFVKSGYHYNKVTIQDILYLSSEHNYVTIVIKNNIRQVVRTSLQELISSLPENFIRAHRSHVININHIDSVRADSLIIQSESVPFSKEYKDELMKRLGIYA